MNKIPIAIQNLTIDAILYLQSKGYKAELPDVKWRHTTGYYSSGKTYKELNMISITSGKNAIDRKLVVLHEIAHIATGVEIKYWNIERAKKQGWIFEIEPTKPIVTKYMSHTDKFWEVAFDLYRHFKLPMRYCINREKSYRKAAIKAYRNNRRQNAK